MLRRGGVAVIMQFRHLVQARGAVAAPQFVVRVLRDVAGDAVIPSSDLPSWWSARQSGASSSRGFGLPGSNSGVAGVKGWPAVVPAFGQHFAAQGLLVLCGAFGGNFGGNVSKRALLAGEAGVDPHPRTEARSSIYVGLRLVSRKLSDTSSCSAWCEDDLPMTSL